MPRPKRHHFIARSHLRAFAVGRGEDQVWFYDKDTGGTRLTAIANAAVQGDYYTVPTAKGKDDRIETMFAKLELAGSRALRCVRGAVIGPFTLDATYRDWLATYVALQFTRVPAQRERFWSIANFQASVELDMLLSNREKFRARMRENGSTESDRDLERQRVEDLQALRENRLMVQAPEQSSLLTMLQGALVISPLLREMSWWVFKRFRSPRFVIGDSPVTLWADNTPPFMGIGFGTPGVEVAMSVAPDTVLVGVRDEIHAARVFEVTDEEMVQEFNARTWVASARFVYGACEEDLVAARDALGEAVARRKPTTFDAHVGPREWAGYATSAKWRQPSKRQRDTSRAGSR